MSVGEGIGQAVGWICQTTVLVFEVYWCYQWWDTEGLVVGILGGPIIAFVFPFLYWFKEGFSLLYVSLWIVGIIAFAYANALKRLRERAL